MFPKGFQSVLCRAVLPVMVGSMALPASAQFIDAPGPQDILATDFIGMPVYSVEATAAGGGTTVPDLGARAGWESIGEIDDLLLDQTGKVRAVLVDVGGFLGIGARTVAVDMTKLMVLSDETGERFVTAAATRPDLEAAPPFTTETTVRTGEGQTVGTSTPRTDTVMGADPAATATSPAPNDPSGMGTDPVATATPPVQTDQAGMDPSFVPVPAEAVTADQLQDRSVYDATGTSIGEIAEVFVQDGQVTEVLIDVGGFLGVGERRVMFPFDELTVLQRPGDDDLRVQVDASRESLEQMPAREG